MTMRTKPTVDSNGVPIDEGGSITTWNYSPITGLLESKLDTNGKGPSYTYTSGGRLFTRTWARPLSETDPTRVQTIYGYTHGLLTSVTYNDETPDLEYGYTRFGSIDTVKRAGILHADYDYDTRSLSRSVEKVNQDTVVPRSINRHRDTEGRLLSVEVAGEYATAYGYDMAGRVNRVWCQPSLDSSKAPTGDPHFVYGYEPESYGLVSSITGPAHNVANIWEADRDVISEKVNTTAAGAVSSFKYEVNDLGQRKTVGPVLDDEEEAVSTYHPRWNWDYNERGELVQANDQSAANHDRAYQYDAIGNRAKVAVDSLTLPITSNYVSNELNQYTAVPSFGSDLEFDLDGNMIAGPLPGSAGLDVGVPSPASATLKWDAENRLIEATVAGTTVAYSYDHRARLISRSIGSATTYYLYDGWNRIEEFIGTTLGKTFLWGLDLSGTRQGSGGVDGLLAVYNGGELSFPTYDGNGNISEYLAMGGGEVAHFEYDPFGNMTVDSEGNSSEFPYRFSTKPQDDVTGLYYYGYRYYDSVTGGWISRDPIGEIGGMNLRGFVSNDAVNFVDVLGLVDFPIPYDDSSFGRLGRENPNLPPTVPQPKLVSPPGGFEGSGGCQCGPRFHVKNGDAFAFVSVKQQASIALRLTVTLERPEECACTRVRVLQAIRVIKRNASSVKNKEEFVPSTDQGGTVRQRRSVPRTGWRIDSGNDDDALWAGRPLLDDSPLGDAAQLGSPARYWDVPGSAEKEGREVYTCVTRDQGYNQEVLACLHWGFFVEREGNAGRPDIKRQAKSPEIIITHGPEVSCGLPADVEAAGKQWNSVEDVKINLMNPR